jgi:hypothetical protein
MDIKHSIYGPIERGWLHGEIPFSKHRITFILLYDKNRIPPTIDYSGLKQTCETRTAENVSMQLCAFQESGNSLKCVMTMCIKNEHLFQIKGVDEEDQEMMKEILFSIRMK